MQWLVKSAAGPSGLSFVCTLYGRNVVTAKVHVNRMKPFHLRTAEFEVAMEHLKLTEESMSYVDLEGKLDHIVDRRTSEDRSCWEYKVVKRDGQAVWVNEDQLGSSLK